MTKPGDKYIREVLDINKRNSILDNIYKLNKEVFERFKMESDKWRKKRTLYKNGIVEDDEEHNTLP